jgi:hypothetical protein
MSVLKLEPFIAKKGNVGPPAINTSSRKLVFNGVAIKHNLAITGGKPGVSGSSAEAKTIVTGSSANGVVNVHIKFSEPTNAATEGWVRECIAKGISLEEIAKRIQLTGPQILSIWDWMTTDAEVRGGPKRKLDSNYHKLARECASELEAAVGGVLGKLGCVYRREDEIRAEGKSTPDFVLNPPILLNGHIVRWIDAKNFYGTKNIPFQKKKLDEAAGKYLRDWGNGCFVFGHGHGDSVTFSGGIVVPVSWSDVSQAVHASSALYK